MLFLCYVGDELECIQPSLYRNVARQLSISVAMESMVSDAFLGVATEIFSTGTHVCSDDDDDATIECEKLKD